MCGRAAPVETGVEGIGVVAAPSFGLRRRGPEVPAVVVGRAAGVDAVLRAAACATRTAGGVLAARVGALAAALQAAAERRVVRVAVVLARRVVGAVGRRAVDAVAELAVFALRTVLVAVVVDEAARVLARVEGAAGLLVADGAVGPPAVVGANWPGGRSSSRNGCPRSRRRPCRRRSGDTRRPRHSRHCTHCWACRRWWCTGCSGCTHRRRRPWR